MVLSIAFRDANPTWNLPELYVRPFDGQYYRDIPLNIEHRATLSAGLGSLFFDQPKLEWDV